MKFLDPHDALRQFGVYGAQDVIDLGSGSGHFALHAAKRLEGGRLFAVDVEKDMLARLTAEAKYHGHDNLHTVWGDICKAKGVPLADCMADRAIAANVLFQVDDRDAFVRETKRLLRPGGKVLVIDWLHHDEAAEGMEKMGPHHMHRINKEEATNLFTRHGFKKEKDIDAGDLHYGMIFTRGE